MSRRILRQWGTIRMISPFVERLALDSPAPSPSPPHRVDPQAGPPRLERRYLPLEKHLGRLREGREQVGDGGGAGVQFRATVDWRTPSRKDSSSAPPAGAIRTRWPGSLRGPAAGQALRDHRTPLNGAT